MLLAHTKDIKENKPLIINHEEEEIALFNIDGQIYAIENKCPHAEGPVAEGDLESSCITCPWHGWQFDIKTGQCLTNPGEEVKTYPIVVKDDGSIHLE